jgi:hypothetical protein
MSPFVTESLLTYPPSCAYPMHGMVKILQKVKKTERKKYSFFGPGEKIIKEKTSIIFYIINVRM